MILQWNHSVHTVFCNRLFILVTSTLWNLFFLNYKYMLLPQKPYCILDLLCLKYISSSQLQAKPYSVSSNESGDHDASVEPQGVLC